MGSGTLHPSQGPSKLYTQHKIIPWLENVKSEKTWQVVNWLLLIQGVTQRRIHILGCNRVRDTQQPQSELKIVHEKFIITFQNKSLPCATQNV